jgi:hypothetical protein
MKRLFIFATLIVSAMPLFAATPVVRYWVDFGSKQVIGSQLGRSVAGLSIPIILYSNNGYYAPSQVTLRYSVTGPRDHSGRTFTCGDQIFVKTTFKDSIKAVGFQVSYPPPKEGLKTAAPEVNYSLHAEIAWDQNLTTRTDHKDLTIQMPAGGTAQCVKLVP